MKGIIRDIKTGNYGTPEVFIQFDVEIPKELDGDETWDMGLLVIENTDYRTSIVRFVVHESGSVDEDDHAQDERTIIPFQIAYAVSIHKAQGLEYNTVKIVITDEVEELVTHDVFYTNITRTRKDLKIYWTPETEEKVLSRIKPKDISRDVEILRKYLA